MFCCALALQAQMEMNVDQLAQFVRSELALKQHSDKQIAAYLKKVHLTEKLTEKTMQDLEAQNAGPKTIEALNALREATANLKPPGHDATYSPATAPDTPVTRSTPTVSLGVRQPIPPPDSVRQQQILDAIREYALNYTANLPNFLCLQVTRRYVDLDSTDRYRLVDSINTQLSYNQGQERYTVVAVNGKLTNVGMYEVATKVGGSISTGEFGSLMSSIFQGKSVAEFNWDHWGTLRGKRVAVFNYFIDSGHSDYRITYNEDQQIITAYKGLIYADEYTGEVSRITFNAVDIPKSFPVNKAYEILDYGDVDISGHTYVCPLKAQVWMESDRQRTRNDIEFRLYRKFGTESTIVYGAEAPAPLSEGQMQEQPASASAASQQPAQNTGTSKPASAPPTNTSSTSNPWKLPAPPPPPPQ
ncbi:MAG: hypothetical protein JOZ62_02345 [Acidobacteriaceae bacterium]|nr:hypothetical protein [Acidobacteriaceae bacterium]